MYSSYCLINVCAVIYKAHTGQIPAKDVKEKCLTCFIAAVAFLVFVSILYKITHNKNYFKIERPEVNRRTKPTNRAFNLIQRNSIQLLRNHWMYFCVSASNHSCCSGSCRQATLLKFYFPEFTVTNF